MDLSREEWRDIPGFEGFYRASTTGKIWSIKSKKEIGKPPEDISGGMLNIFY